MMVRLAFYKAYRGNWLDWLIALYDFGMYSHVELVFSDGVCFSSSPRSKGGDGPLVKGTRFIKIDDLETSGKWDLVDLPKVTPDQEKAMRAWAIKEAEENKGYDFGGVLHFMAPFIKQRTDKWFCSEVDLSCLQVEDFYDDYNASDVSPNGLWRIVHGMNPRYVPWIRIIRNVSFVVESFIKAKAEMV